MIQPAQGSGRALAARAPVVESSIAALPGASVPPGDAPVPRPRLVTDDAPPTALPFVDDEPVVWTATGLERQVFLDHTGRRGRRVRLAGAGLGLLSAGWLAALVTGSIGFSNLPRLPLPTDRLAGPPPARPVGLAAARHNRHHAALTAALRSSSVVNANALARSETAAPPAVAR